MQGKGVWARMQAAAVTLKENPNQWQGCLLNAGHTIPFCHELSFFPRKQGHLHGSGASCCA